MKVSGSINLSDCSEDCFLLSCARVCVCVCVVSWSKKKRSFIGMVMVSVFYMKSLALSPGGHSWGVYPEEDLCALHVSSEAAATADGGAGALAAAATEAEAGAAAAPAVAQLSMALGGLRTVFSPLLFSGLLSFFTWWIAACLFSTSIFGIFYHQYLMAA